MQNPPPPPPPPSDLPPPVYTPPPASLASPSAVPAGYSYTPQPTYGGFWIRWLANLMDSVILYFPALIVSVIVTTIESSLGFIQNSTTFNPQAPAMTPAGFVVGLALGLVFLVWIVGYYVYSWSIGSTIGMKLLRLRVADADTLQPIGIGRALLRYLGFTIAGLVCYLGLIWAAFDDRKQGWHDKLANTVVIWG
jgi:uncharacterized RDD family membrane protein YckC